MLEKFGLDFTVERIPLVGTFNGEVIETPYIGLLNSKTKQYIHKCNQSYTVVQNEQLLDAVMDAASRFSDQMELNFGGVIDGGAKVYMQLAFKAPSLINDDEIRQHITLLDCHDGTRALSAGVGDITMSCSNQFLKFYKEGVTKLYHNVTLEKKVRELPMLLETALKRSVKQIEIYERMFSREVNEKDIDGMVNAVIGYSKALPQEKLDDKSTKAINIMNDVYNSIKEEMSTKGTNLWGLHSGITRYTTHGYFANAANKGKDKASQENRLRAIIIGKTYNLNGKSMDFANRLLMEKV